MELGSKRQCESCGAKFFDLNRDPITCPKCGTIFQVTSTPSRAARAAPDEDEVETDPATPDVVSLEEADDTDRERCAREWRPMPETERGRELYLKTMRRRDALRQRLG